MALMLLPHWTDGCMASMEGLFFEASGTTPYHFLTTAAMSKQSSNPVRELRYDNNDAAKGVPYLQALGVRYVMVRTDEAKRAAEAQPELTLLATSGPWEIFQVADSEVVQPLTVQPVVVDQRDGDQRERNLELGTSWFQHRDEWAAMPADDGPADWQRIHVDVDESRLVPDPDAAEPDTRGKQVDIVVPAGGDRARHAAAGHGERRRDRRAGPLVPRRPGRRPGPRQGLLLPELDGARRRGSVPRRAEPDGRRADGEGRVADVRAEHVGPRLLRLHAARASACWCSSASAVTPTSARRPCAVAGAAGGDDPFGPPPPWRAAGTVTTSAWDRPPDAGGTRPLADDDLATDADPPDGTAERPLA